MKGTLLMRYIFFLQHAYEEGEIEIVTDIAVYSSFERAQAAQKRLKRHPKFSSHPNAFIINKERLNKREWCEGFTPMQEDE